MNDFPEKQESLMPQEKHILPFVPLEEKTHVSGLRIKEYVMSRVPFPLTEKQFEILEDLLRDYWDSLPDTAYLSEKDLVRALEGIYSHGILIGRPYLQKIALLVLEALEIHGYIDPV